MTIVPSRTLTVTDLTDLQSLDGELLTDVSVDDDGEIIGTTIIGVSLDDITDGGGLTLREAVHLANLFAEFDGSATRIVFDPSLEGDIYRLTEGQIDIAADVIIDGDSNSDGIPDIIISGDANGDDLDANGQSGANSGTGITDLSRTGESLLDDNNRIFNVDSAADALELENVILTGGRYDEGSSGNGGAVSAEGVLGITNSRFVGNSTGGSNAEGGAVFARGALTIDGSTFTGNRTNGSGSEGGAVYGASTVDVEDSAFDGNSTIGGIIRLLKAFRPCSALPC